MHLSEKEVEQYLDLQSEAYKDTEEAVNDVRAARADPEDDVFRRDSEEWSLDRVREKWNLDEEVDLVEFEEAARRGEVEQFLQMVYL